MSQRVADVLPIGVIVADVEGFASFANPAWVETTGQSDAAWTGLGWLSVLTTDERQPELANIRTAIALGLSYRSEWRLTDSAERQRVLDFTAAPDIVDGRLMGFVALVRDVTDEQAQTELLLYKATHDPLTGLTNRAQFLEFVEHALDRQRRKPATPAAVLFIDVDRLKRTNDRFGHDVGDRVLRSAAARISKAVRPADVVARYGGDEFTVLCEDLPTADGADTIADRIRAASLVPQKGEIPFTLSIGISVADDPAMTASRIVHDADQDMYRDKLRHAGQLDEALWARDGGASRSRRDHPSNGHGHGPQSIETVPPARRPDPLARAVHDLRTSVATIIGFANTLRKHRDTLSPTEVDGALVAVENQTYELSRKLDDLLDHPARGGH